MTTTDTRLRICLGAVLRGYARRRNLRAHDIARTVGIHPASMTRIYRGDTNPSVQVFWAVCCALGVSEWYAFTRRDRVAKEFQQLVASHSAEDLPLNALQGLAVYLAERDFALYPRDPASTD